MIYYFAANTNRLYHLFKAIFSGGVNYLIIFVTGRCNLRCDHCFYLDEIEAADKNKELSLEEYKLLSQNTKNAVQLTFTGGETFVREDLPEVIELFYKNSGTRFISLNTNATLTEKTVNDTYKILKACPYAQIRISLSLDGLEETHNQIRGGSNTFGKFLRTYEKLKILAEKHKNLRIDVGTVLSQKNRKGINEVIDFVKNNIEVENHGIIFPRGNIREPNAIKVTIDEYDKALAYMKAKRKDKKYNTPFVSWAFRYLRSATERMIKNIVKTASMPFQCVAGDRFIEISERGDVFPCETLQGILDKSKANFSDTVMGNIRDYKYDLTKVKQSLKGNSIVQYIKDGNCACTFECAISASIVLKPKNWKVLLNK